MRDLGVTSVLAPHVPELLVPVLVVVTFFGSPTFFAVAAPAFSLVGYRRTALDRQSAFRFLAIAALVFGGTTLLKNGLTMPRPPASIHLVAEDGFGFPSGHATVTTGTLFALVAVVERRVEPWHLGAVGAWSVVIAATRVLLGVHYLVDVVAGIIVGLGFVGVGLALTKRTLGGTFLVGVAMAAGGAALAI